MRSKQVQKFKETEIGKIPTDWEIKTLESIIEKKSDIIAGPFGSNLKVEDYRDEGIPIIRLQNIERYNFIKKDIKYISTEKYEELKYHSFKDGDIVLAKLGIPIGKSCMVPKDFLKGIVTADVVRIRISNNIVDNYFLLHIANSDYIKNQLSARQIGTTRPRVNLSDVRELLIPFPPIHEQHRIGRIFFSIDSKIKNLQNQNKTLEQIVQTIFKSWFVDFDGVTEFEDSELGQIPKGWSVDKISSICETFGGGTPSTTNQDYWNGKINWLVPRDLTNSDRLFCTSSERKITELGLRNCSSKLHPENSILMTSRATIGVFAINRIPVATNQGFIVIIPKNPTHLYYLFLNLTHRVDEFIRHANGSTFLEISRGNFRRLPILIPPSSILDMFHNEMKQLFEKRFVNEQRIQILTQIRDSLLPKLMSGEIRV